MPDVNFRMADFGRAEITVDGVDYYMQAYPPSLINCEAPPERMIGEMDLVGVDMGVLQHDHIYGALDEYYGEQMRRFPNRFIGLAQVREWEADKPAEHERLEQAVCEHGLKGLYFSVEPFALSNYATILMTPSSSRYGRRCVTWASPSGGICTAANVTASAGLWSTSPSSTAGPGPPRNPCRAHAWHRYV